MKLKSGIVLLMHGEVKGPGGEIEGQTLRDDKLASW